MARTSYEVKVVGLREVQRKLRWETTLQEPYRETVEAAAAAAERSIRGTAPRGETGQLEAKLTHKISAAPIPRWAIVKTSATRTSKKYRRYSYPRRLEFDPHSKHKDWLLKGLLRAKGTIDHLMNDMARKVEQRWRT